MRLFSFAFLVSVALTGAAAAQSAEPLFNGKNLDGWKREFADAKVRDGAIQVESSTGWVRTNRPYADFVLTFEMRMAEGGRGGVFVRSWPSFVDKAPADAFRLTKRFTRTERPDVAWETWRVECEGRRIRLLIDGELVYANEAVQNPQGFVALWASDGTAQFRAVEIRSISSPSTNLPGVVSPKDPGVVMPKLLREVKPAYTRAAMERHIQGTVLLDAVVETDGTIGNVFVTRSLDPEYGLDKSAVAAAKDWRFIAATRDGMPVRILVTIELAFTLK